jgi:spermidine synthase
MMALGDFTAQRIAWSPYRLAAARDTRYGKLQIIRQGEQVSLYNSGRKSYTHPDPVSNEEAAHFALLQIPGARQVLVLGGGGGGIIGEILKYPDTRITWIEIDPQAFPFWKAHLPDKDGWIENNPRVSLIHADGRDYLRKTKTRYDAVIVNLGDPENARLNRFYTREFFRLVRSRLNRDGIFSFRTSGAGAYIGPARENYLTSLFKTLRDVFPHAAVVPGENWVFLAGESPPDLDPQTLTDRMEENGIQTQYVAPGFLFTRLDPLRKEQIDNLLQTPETPFNLDRRPIGYLLTIRLWAERSQSPAAALFQSAARADIWLMVIPLLAWAGLMPVLMIRRLRNSGALLAAPMFTLGVSTMVAEVLVLMAYQTSHGSLYGDLSALLTAFMLGLGGGAAIGRKTRASFREIVVLQSILFGMMILLRMALFRFFPFGEAALYLFLLGAVNGRLFLAANRFYLKSGSRYGLGYGLDLIGSFAGALGSATLLIPLFGYFPVAEALILLNATTVLALAAARRLG